MSESNSKPESKKPKQLSLDWFISTKRRNKDEDTNQSDCQSDSQTVNKKRKLNLKFVITMCLNANRTEMNCETACFNVSERSTAASTTSIATIKSVSSSTTAPSTNVTATVTTNANTATTATSSISVNLNVTANRE